jgi:hypothetical protein
VIPTAKTARAAGTHVASRPRPILRLMPFASMPAAEQVNRRDKVRIAAVVVAILLVLAAVAVWAAVRPGSYGSSKNGCITITLPSTTGGALVHQCGPAAKAMCQRAFSAADKVSLLTRPQCRLAGIAPSQAVSGTAN